MANYDILKESIAAVIKENGNQEITGNLLQQTLFAMVNTLGGGYEFAGVADQAVIPGTPDTKLFYIAAGPGVYANFGGITVNNGELAIFFIPEGYGSWYKQSAQITNSGMFFGGIVGPASSPTVTDNKTFYIATTPGTYTNFSNLIVAAGELVIFTYSGSAWIANRISSVATPIVDNLTDGGATSALSAEQGKNLNIADYQAAMQRRLAYVINGSIGFEPTPMVGGIDSNNKWIYVDNYRYLVFPVKQGDSIYLKKGDGNIVYCFLSENVPPIWLSNAPLLPGTTRQTIPSEATITVPENCFLYLFEGIGNNIYFPGVISINGTQIFPVIQQREYSRYISATKTFGYTTKYAQILKASIQRLCFYSNFNVKRIALYYTYISGNAFRIAFANCDNLADTDSIYNLADSYYFSGIQNLISGQKYARVYLKNSSNIDVGYLDVDLEKFGTMAIMGTVAKNFATAGFNCYDTDYSDIATIAEKSDKINGMVESLGNFGIKFSGSDAGNVLYLKNNIVLSGNGDSLEIKFDSIGADSFPNGGYSFTKKPDQTSVRGIFVTNTKYRARADDGTWLLAEQRSFAPGKTLKVSYEEGNIKFYIDNVLDYTYTGQKTITIGSFGDGVISPYLYWNGVISGIKVNGELLNIYTDFIYGNKVRLYRSNYFLTDEQAALLVGSFPEMFAEKTATALYVYRKLTGSYYIKYPLVYRYQAYVAEQYPSFYDNWGISPIFLCKYEAAGMMQIAQLFNPGETELAINVENLNDGSTYVGGAAHGFENIVSINSTRQINFLVDDTAVAEDSVFALKEVSSVKVTQLSELCQAYTNSNPWAEATKEWHWDKDGFAISTSVKVLRSLQISQAQFGMFCVFRHWLGKVSNDYLTNKGIKNSDPYKIYTIEDGWESNPDNAGYHNKTFDCTRITQYGERGLGFAMQIADATTKANGGMFVGTNNTKYNKIYFDLTGSYLPSINEILKATQKWYISGQPILS